MFSRKAQRSFPPHQASTALLVTRKSSGWSPVTSQHESCHQKKPAPSIPSINFPHFSAFWGEDQTPFPVTKLIFFRHSWKTLPWPLLGPLLISVSQPIDDFQLSNRFVLLPLPIHHFLGIFSYSKAVSTVLAKFDSPIFSKSFICFISKIHNINWGPNDLLFFFCQFDL